MDMIRRLDNALDAAVVVMRNGGSTAAAARSFTNILTGCEIQGLETVWRLDFVAASGDTREGRLTALRSVGPIGVNLVRAGEMVTLSERVARGQVSAEAAGCGAEPGSNAPLSLPWPRTRACRGLRRRSVLAAPGRRLGQSGHRLRGERCGAVAQAASGGEAGRKHGGDVLLQRTLGCNRRAR